MARGHRRRQEARQERELDKWRRTRLLATILANANRGENDPAQTPEQFMPLPGDAPEAALQVMSEDEFDRIAGL